MADLGRPISYLVLEAGTPVYDQRDRRIGRVHRVQADDELDIFHGLIVQTGPLTGHLLFADADQIAALHEHGVRLRVAGDQLRRPTAGGTGGTPRTRLRRAREWISRNRKARREH